MPFPAIDLTEAAFPISLRFAEPMSDEQLMEFSEGNRPFRIERSRGGEITIMSPTWSETGEHEAYVGSMLYVWNRNTGGGRVFNSAAGFNLPDGSCLSPDVSWIQSERVRALTKQERQGFYPLCPDFVIEIRSQTDRRRQLEEKMALWMDNGAKLAWLIDPVKQEVVVYRAGEAVEVLEKPDVVMGHAPVQGFGLEMSPIWDSEQSA